MPKILTLSSTLKPPPQKSQLKVHVHAHAWHASSCSASPGKPGKYNSCTQVSLLHPSQPSSSNTAGSTGTPLLGGGGGGCVLRPWGYQRCQGRVGRDRSLRSRWQRRMRRRTDLSVKAEAGWKCECKSKKNQTCWCEIIPLTNTKPDHQSAGPAAEDFNLFCNACA